MAIPGSGSGQDRLSRALTDTRQLRRSLQEFAQGGCRQPQRHQPVVVTICSNRRPCVSVTWTSSATSSETWIQLSDDVMNLFRDLSEAGVSMQDIDEIRRLAAEVRASDFSGNEDILNRESQAALSLVEQLELALAAAAAESNDSVRLKVVDDIPETHRETVANYYRRLGESDESDEDR